LAHFEEQQSVQNPSLLRLDYFHSFPDISWVTREKKCKMEHESLDIKGVAGSQWETPVISLLSSSHCFLFCEIMGIFVLQRGSRRVSPRIFLQHAALFDSFQH